MLSQTTCYKEKAEKYTGSESDIIHLKKGYDDSAREMQIARPETQAEMGVDINAIRAMMSKVTPGSENDEDGIALTTEEIMEKVKNMTIGN